MSGKAKDAKLTYFKDVKPVAVNWIAKPFFASGKIVVVQGDPGSGKTALMLYIAAHISTGAKLPFTDSEPVMGTVIYHKTPSPRRQRRNRKPSCSRLTCRPSLRTDRGKS